MLRRVILIGGIVTLGVVWSGAEARTIFVNSDATGSHDGTSWADAYTDLQDALAAADGGDAIWVAAGSYRPTRGTDRNKSFALKASVALLGGFAGTETALEQRDWKAHETILSGEIGVQSETADNTYHVLVGASNATLDGFTITGGNAGSSNGGGMINETVSPSLHNCIFSGNTANTGGGMYNSNASPTLTDCAFSGNSALHGGAMENKNSSPSVSHSTFSANSAQYGGAIENINSWLIVSNCAFSGNESGGTSYASGGAICNNDIVCSLTMTNCVFSGNSAVYGGALYNKSERSQTVTNCTFSENSATHGGSIYSSAQNRSITVTNCILWCDAPTLVLEAQGKFLFCHCDIQACGGSGEHWWSVGTDGGANIDFAPRFVNFPSPAGPDCICMTADDGLRLRSGSPCIDAGTAEGAPAEDILYSLRTGFPDIGAYEHQANAVRNWIQYP